jgi:hypothetical protein
MVFNKQIGPLSHKHWFMMYPKGIDATQDQWIEVTGMDDWPECGKESSS